ncbi:LPS assembly lipoprotein LptE [Vulgatibacter sp.]|uniref:LPS assembly lipoprotein LptE n=1 Tax=Vulgatibacter sp. TaxID=1971226 RepID=UPI003564748E
MRRGLLGAVALAAALAGCGYRFAVGGPGLPDGVGQVHVPVFANRSTDAEAGAIFAEAMAEALARSGHAGGPSAPARLEGTVLSTASRPAATGPDGRDTGLYRLEARLRVELLRQGQLLCVREIAGGEDYLPAADLLGIEASRRQALRRLAGRLMESASVELCAVVAAE